MPDTRSVQQTPLEAKSPFELRVNLSSDLPEKTIRSALATGDSGFLHSFTPGTAVDGPGVRVVAWMSGCMWRCVYCHNPDTWTITNGILVPVARALEELQRCRLGLNTVQSGFTMQGGFTVQGGFTLSGGEPLMQHRFAAKLLAGAKAMGIHTALDTNGYSGDKLSDGELETIDLVLLDLKAWDSARHRQLTGMNVEPTHTFARRLAARRRPVWVRYVLVPGLTDDLGEIAKIAHFAAALGNVERVHVLPFHQMGKFKWKQLGMDYTLENTDPPDQELAEEVCDVFRAAGLKAA